MKKYWLFSIIAQCSIFLLCIALSISCTIGASKPPEMPPLSEEEIKLFEEIFANMDDKTLEALAQIGEEYIKEMEAQGKDPYEIFKEPLIVPQQPLTPPAPVKNPEVQPTPQPVIIYPPQKIAEVRALFTDMVRILSDILTKAQSKRITKDMISTWRYHIEDLIYYAHLFQQEKFAKLFLEKQEESLLLKIKNMVENLSLFNSLFSIPAESLDADRSYLALGLSANASFAEVQQTYQRMLFDKNPDLIKKQLVGKPDADIAKALELNSEELDTINRAYQTLSEREQALESLNNILEVLYKNIYTDEILAQCKRIVEKIEPETAKIKEAQEKRELEARKEQEENIKRRPPLSARIFEPSFGRPDSTYTPTGRFERPYQMPSSSKSDDIKGKDIPSKPLPAPEKKAPSDKKKDEKKKPKEKEDKDKDSTKDEKKELKDTATKQPKRAKFSETSKNVAQKLEKIQALFQELVEYIATTIDPVEEKEETVSPKDLFTQFSDYLLQSLPTPYNHKDPAFLKAKQIVAALTNITESIHGIKKEARMVNGLNAQEKKELKNGMQELLKEYGDTIFQKDLRELTLLNTTPDLALLTPEQEEKAISKDKKFIFFGRNEFGDALNQSEYQPLRDLNPPLLPALQDDQPAQSINYIAQFKDAYNALQKDFGVGFSVQEKPTPVPLVQP